MYDYKMEHIFSYKATLKSPPELIGPTPEGIRLNFYVTGGDIDGPRLRGRLLPVGADWLTIREDGIAILDVRATIETHDGALIYLQYSGVAELGADGYQRFLDGNPTMQFPIRAVPRFITSHPDYLWLNRLQCVNIGEGNLAESYAAYDVYALG
jgi:hypothetical protein